MRILSHFRFGTNFRAKQGPGFRSMLKRRHGRTRTHVGLGQKSALLTVLRIGIANVVLLPMSQDRSNIPSMQHCIWLTMVTMTSVGYGDYYPTSLEGYLTVSVLTFVSVLFLALPVGIIGFEFTRSWQNRAKVLLINKTRKCLEKWGYSASDVKVLFDYVDVDGDGNLNLSASWF